MSITLSLRKTSQESINLERKSFLDCSSDTLCKRGVIWKGDIPVADIEDLEIYVVQVKIDDKTANMQARSFMVRTLEINGKARQAEGEAKVV